GRLFSGRQAREMWSSQTILPIADPPPPLAALRPSFSEYGLGWRLRDYQGRKLVSHTGGLAGMTSQITLVPAEKLGIVVLTNSESDLMAALTYRLLDDLLAAPRPRADWVAAFAQAAQIARSRADSTLKTTGAGRDSLSQPSLPLAGYAGSYRDELYGDASVALKNGRLRLRLGARDEDGAAARRTGSRREGFPEAAGACGRDRRPTLGPRPGHAGLHPPAGPGRRGVPRPTAARARRPSSRDSRPHRAR